MKRQRSKLSKKIVSIISLAIIVSIFVGSSLVSSLMYSAGFYNSDKFSDTVMCQEIMYDYYRQLVNDISDYQKSGINKPIELDDVSSVFIPHGENSPNFLFLVYDQEGNVILRNTEHLTDINRSNILVSYDEGQNLNIMYSLTEELTGDDELTKGQAFYVEYAPYKWLMFALSIISFGISAVLYVYLMCLAGHRDDSDEIVLNPIDKIPLEIYLALVSLVSFILINMIFMIYDQVYNWSFLLFSFPVLILLGLVFLSFSLTLATRYKAKTLIKNTLVHKTIRFFIDLLDNVRLLSQVIILFAVYGVFIIFFPDLWILTTFVFVIVLFVVMARAVLQLERLFESGKKLAEGDLDYQIDTRNMKWKFKQHAQDLNHIRLGISRAVENQMKSERMKTELITNVSHDIKTPLTSIINYVDLLKKEELNNKMALEYIEVLDRQSKRLKKMTEDLVEASKASSGSIPVVFERIDIVEFVDQAIGEYTEIFQTKGLKVIVNSSDAALYVPADGKLLWRVFDNLFTNINKYAQVDTRIYVDINQRNDKIMVAIKNISSEPLNISADELLERFVRGDSSRTTEGSGLGLSITRSLLELQKAQFTLDIDGDMFKALITFDKA